MGKLQMSHERRLHIRSLHLSGRTREEIAAALGVKPSTVKTYFSAMRKLGDIPYERSRPPRGAGYQSLLDPGPPIAAFLNVDLLKRQNEDFLKAMTDAEVAPLTSLRFPSQSKGPWA